jgi:predicted kinase
MKRVVFLSGLPASGKSTWAKKYVKHYPNTIRINKDDMRSMFAKEWDKDFEKFIFRSRSNLLRSALNHGLNVVTDDTNLSSSNYNEIYRLCEEVGDCELIHIHIDTPLQTCIARDKIRDKKVNENVIMDFYNRYLKSGNFKIHETKIFEQRTEVKLKEKNPDLPDCIICDLDGTLSLINGRNPYNASACYDDDVNEAILTIIKKVPNQFETVFFFSGRDEKYREQTIKFLKDKCGIRYIDNNVKMRKSGDYRKDSIIKEEMYNEFIKDKYNVKFVIDDRLQVCRLWYKLGLPLLRYGNPDADF